MPAWDVESEDRPNDSKEPGSIAPSELLTFLKQLANMAEKHFQTARCFVARIEELSQEQLLKHAGSKISGALPVRLLCLMIFTLLVVCLWPIRTANVFKSDHADFTFGIETADLPYYDIVALIYATASEQDVQRMSEASNSWLRWNSTAMSFNFVFAICADDPGTWRVFGQPHVALIPCVHGYGTLVTKGIEGYRYLSSHFRYKYVLKADIDTVVPMDCIEQGINSIDSKSCPSFGMGRWYPPQASKVWQYNDMPYGPKYHNEAYAADTGAEFYLPYMSGWAILWSADVAQMLGMFGHERPRWRSTWTIDDAAIGTFIVGLDICRLHLPCDTPTDVKAQDMASRNAALDSNNKVEAPTTGPQMALKGFDGPLDDDVPGPGDLANVQATSLGNCAGRCLGLPDCKSFEYSPTQGIFEAIRNCQLATGNQRSGLAYKDFKLYIRQAT